MSNPPAAVKLAMEPVIALLENKDKKVEWADIKAIVRQDGFKNRVLDFQKEDIKAKCKNFIVKNYLQDETTYDIEKFYKASKAAGPLAKWLKSIIEFAEIYEQIAPMREQVKQLQDDVDEMEAGLTEVEAEIAELQTNFDNMQMEYQVLVTELTNLEQE